MSLNSCIDFFIQQQELIQKYNYDKSQPSEQIFSDIYMLKKKKMFILWTWTWNKKGKIPCIWGNLYKLLKKESFSSSMQILREKKKFLELKNRKLTWSLFSKKQKQECRKNWTKRKKRHNTKG